MGRGRPYNRSNYCKVLHNTMKIIFIKEYLNKPKVYSTKISQTPLELIQEILQEEGYDRFPAEAR